MQPTELVEFNVEFNVALTISNMTSNLQNLLCIRPTLGYTLVSSYHVFNLLPAIALERSYCLLYLAALSLCRLKTQTMAAGIRLINSSQSCVSVRYWICVIRPFHCVSKNAPTL